MKLECHQASSASLQQELETALSQCEQKHTANEKKLEELHLKKTLDLTVHIDDLKTEIGKLHVSVIAYLSLIQFWVYLQ